MDAVAIGWTCNGSVVKGCVGGWALNGIECGVGGVGIATGGPCTRGACMCTVDGPGKPLLLGWASIGVDMVSTGDLKVGGDIIDGEPAV